MNNLGQMETEANDSLKRLLKIIIHLYLLLKSRAYGKIFSEWLKFWSFPSHQTIL